jgi:DNA-binding transcriptional LysR family regulator
MTSEHNLSGRGKKSSIDLRRLKYFRAVCDHGGFSRAASVIGVAQPALTRQIKLLEAEIGLPLIERNGRGAKPSEQGRFLLDRARGLLDGLDEVVRDLRQAFTAAGGAVTLGVCPTIAPFFVDDLTEHVARNHPNLSLSVIQAYSGDLRNLMAVGRLDMALTYSTPMSSESFTSRDLFSERLVLVSGYSRVRRRKRCRLAELASLKLILPSRIHTLRGIIDRACSMQAIVLKP